MKKFIYKGKDLRCRIKYSKLLQHYELQIQKRSFLVWFNVYKWMTVRDGFWGEGGPIKVLKDSYQYGNMSECYPTGQLNIPERVEFFFDEYYSDLDERSRNAEIIKQVV